MNNYITYGYRLVDGDMRMDLGQSEAVHLIFDAYDGGESIKKIAGMLKDKKVPSVCGKPSWTPALIRKILSNKDYLGVEPYPRMIEDEQFKRVQEQLKRSRDLWNQRHPSGSIQRTSMYTGRLICSSCGGVYAIYKQSGRGDKRDVRYWKCRHYDPATKEPCKMPILTEKQLDGLFLQALVRMKTEPALYHEETKKILTGIIKERQRMESELNGDWNKCNEDYKRIEQLYFQIAAQPDRSLKFELINNAIVLQYPEIKTKDKKSKNIRYCVPFGYWLDGQEVPIIHEQYGPIVQMLFQSYAEGISLTTLAKELVHQSIPNQKGKPAWSHSCIRNILTNPVYLGDKKFPALVTRELFTQVQTRLEETGRKKRESRTKAADGKEELRAKGGTNRRGHPGHLEPDR